MVEEEDRKWAVSIEWDFKFNPKSTTPMEEYVRIINEFDKRFLNSKNIPTVSVGSKLVTGIDSAEVPDSREPSQRSQNSNSSLGFKAKTDDAGGSNPREDGQEGGYFFSSSRGLNDVELFEPAARENITSSFENDGVGMHFQRDVIVSTVNKFHCLRECGSEGEVPASNRLELIDSILATEALGMQDINGCEGVVTIIIASSNDSVGMGALALDRDGCVDGIPINAGVNEPDLNMSNDRRFSSSDPADDLQLVLHSSHLEDIGAHTTPIRVSPRQNDQNLQLFNVVDDQIVINLGDLQNMNIDTNEVIFSTSKLVVELCCRMGGISTKDEGKAKSVIDEILFKYRDKYNTIADCQNVHDSCDSHISNSSNDARIMRRLTQGIILVLMGSKVLSWNIRGLNEYIKQISV